MTLQQLGEKYPSDKLQHLYLPHYEEYLKKLKPKKMLEIGCFKGDSLRMWLEFMPDIELHCLDLFEEHQPPEDLQGKVTFWKGDQTDPIILSKLAKENFEWVTEDGSHNSRDQWDSFNALWPSVQMMYVVEDLHCCKEEFYRQGLTFEQTMLGKMQAWDFPHRFTLINDKISFITKDVW